MARIGFLPEHFRFHEWLQAAELLDLHGRLYGMDARRPPPAHPRAARTGRAGRARAPIRSPASPKGMLQRIGLAQALLNDPELVFLDEPTSALDPFGRMLVRGIIHDLKARGTTVFLNSHLLGEVEATCDRVSFIKEGRVLRTLALRDLDAGQLHVELRVDAVTPACWPRALRRHRALAQHGGSRWARRQPCRLHRRRVAECAGHCQHAWNSTVADEELLPRIAERTWRVARGSMP